MDNSFLKWAGSKFNALEEVYKVVPRSGSVLIEPFMGACNVALNADYDKLILSDSNSDLVELCHWASRKPKDLITQASPLFTGEFNTVEKYYELRSRYNHSKCPKERALLFLYLNRHTYNGLSRYNKSGFFNTSFGFYKNPILPIDAIHNFSKKLKRANFKKRKFEALKFNSGENVTVYCDPPYLPLSKTASFSAYTKEGFTPESHDLLNKKCSSWAKKGSLVFLSNHKSPLIDVHYSKGDIVSSFDVRRSISCKGDNRGNAPEVILKY